MSERHTHPTPQRLRSLEHVDAQRWQELFFELRTVGCVVADADTLRCVRVNDCFASMLGYRPDEVSGRTWVELTHADDRDTNRALFDELLRGVRQSYTLRKRYLHKDGHTVHGDVEVRALRAESGEVELLFATIHHADAEVHRTEELERERVRYRLLSTATRAITRNATREELATELASAIRSTLGGRAVVVDVWVDEMGAPPSTGADARVSLALREALETVLSERYTDDEPPTSRPRWMSVAIDAQLGEPHATLAALGARRAVGHAVYVHGRIKGALLVALAEHTHDAALDTALGELAAEASFALERREWERERARMSSELEQAIHALESSSVVLYRAKLEPGFPLTYLSSNAARFGFDVDRMRSSGGSFDDVVHPDDAARVQAEMLEVLDGGRREATQRYRVRNSVGATFEVEDSFQLVDSGEGGRLAVEGVLRDITAQAEAERAIARSEVRYRQLFDLSPSPMWVFDIETLRFLEVNRAAVEHYGYTREEFLERTLLDIRPVEDEQRLRDAVGVRPEGFDHSGLWRHRKRDGTLIDVEITSHQLEFDGRRAELVLANDVSARETAELRAHEAITNLERTLLSTVDAVARMVEVRDPYTAGHERRVSELSVAFGREMGLDEFRLEGLRIGGYVHDVGKIAIPAEILAKPTRLSKMEFEIIKTHAQRGYEILEPVSFPWPVAEMARQHHERMDGSGYPQGLRGDAILLEARILAVADVVESMASDRPYRPGLGLAAALEEIEKNQGRLYDADVADVCLRLFRSGALDLPG